MWAAMVKGSGAKQVEIGTPIDPSAPAIFRGLQFGSEKMFFEVLRRRHPFYFIDSGYFRAFDAAPRLYYRVVKNGFHQNTIIKRDNGERWRALGLSIKDWRRQGDHILVCPPASQPVKDLFWGHSWLDNVMRQLPMYTDRVIVIRPKYSPGSIIEAGQKAWCVVTHLSNVAVDLALHGIPSIVWNGNPAQPIADTELCRVETPVYSDERQAWAESLACAQFTIEEMASGLAWEMVK